MSEKESNKVLDKLIAKANNVAITVVGLATIALIGIVYILIFQKPTNTAPKEITVKYEIVVDTIALKKEKDSLILKTVSNIDENNKKILEEINASVSSQYKRMESILEVQEDRSKMFSYGAGFLAILVAIATFFGFKSINEMKKGTIDAAEYEAQKTAEVKAKEVAETKAKEVAETKAKEVAETKAKEVAEAKAKEVAETKAKEVAEAKAKEVAEAKAKEVAEAKAKEVAETKAKEVAEIKAKEVATKTAKKETKAELRQRLNDIQVNLKNSLELEFNDKFDKYELSVSDEWENRLKNDFEEIFEKINEEIESLKIQFETLDKTKVTVKNDSKEFSKHQEPSPQKEQILDENEKAETINKALQPDDESSVNSIIHDIEDLYNDEDLNN